LKIIVSIFGPWRSGGCDAAETNAVVEMLGLRCSTDAVDPFGLAQLHAWIDRVHVRLHGLVAMLKAIPIRRVLP
jgi:hypothetical protein